MKVVIQRVTSASVTVGTSVAAEIAEGLVALVAVAPSDSQKDVELMARKIVGLRVFRDDAGQMNRSVVDAGGSVLVVSQFTLYGDARKGRRPSFVNSAPSEFAAPMIERLVAAIKSLGVAVEQGVFGADMALGLVNDGPVTLVLETRDGSLV